MEQELVELQQTDKQIQTYFSLKLSGFTVWSSVVLVRGYFHTLHDHHTNSTNSTCF